jgi:hypothetical protein
MNRHEKHWELLRLRAIRSVKQHYYSVHLYRTLDRILTVLNVGASIAVLWLSAALHEPTFTNGPFGLLALAGVSVVITSVLQYIFDWRSLWRQHEDAGIRCARLNRRLEFGPTNNIRAELCKILKRMHRDRKAAPTIPRVFWNHPKALSRSIASLEACLGGAPAAGSAGQP